MQHKTDRFYVTNDTCTHGEASLCDGFVDAAKVECPWHSGKFCIKDGNATAFPAIEPTKVYRTRVVDGQVFINPEKDPSGASSRTICPRTGEKYTQLSSDRSHSEMNQIADEFVIPARYGRAFHVNQGQTLRIFAVEDGQVGDCVFYNAHDTREWFHVGQSWALNGILGTGTAKSFRHFYSKPPRENVMLTVLEDTYPHHWGNMGGRCSARLYQLRDNIAHGHRSCQQNLTEALAPYGLSGDDVMDVFNVFMNVELHPDGSFTIRPSEVKKGDYIELRAEMDVLAAVSACPADTSPTNGGTCRPLGIRICAKNTSDPTT